MSNHLENDLKNREEAAKEKENDSADATIQQGSEDSSQQDNVDTHSHVDMTRASTTDFEPPSLYRAADYSKPVIVQGNDLSMQTHRNHNDLFSNTDNTYTVASLNGEEYSPEPEMFYSEEYEHKLSSMIDYVIDTEGPIHEDVLIRRIARHHGFQRAGRRIHDIVVKIAKRRRGRTKEDIGLFFWRKDMVKDRLAPARYQGRDDELRKVEYICREEIQAINNLLSLSRDPIEFARCIGIGRLNESARLRIQKALN